MSMCKLTGSNQSAVSFFIWFSLTCADAKQYTKSLKDTDNLIRQDIEPGNGHGKGPYHQYKLHNTVGRSLGTQNKEQEDAEHNCCMEVHCGRINFVIIWDKIWYKQYIYWMLVYEHLALDGNINTQWGKYTGKQKVGVWLKHSVPPIPTTVRRLVVIQ